MKHEKNLKIKISQENGQVLATAKRWVITPGLMVTLHQVHSKQKQLFLSVWAAAVASRAAPMDWQGDIFMCVCALLRA